MTSRAPAGRFVVEALGKAHLRDGFSCGVGVLDDYLKKQASQDTRKHTASVFVAVQPGSQEVCGFYTLSMAAVNLDLLPAALAKKVPRYPTVPAVRLGRLAVHQDLRGQGLGQHLLMDAIHRALQNELAWAALVVDAKDDQAKAFYLQYGFQPFLDRPLNLYAARGTLESLFR